MFVLSRSVPQRLSSSRRYASSLVLGEFDGKGVLSGATRAAVTAARKVGGPLHMLLAGAGAKAAATSAAQVAGVEKVLYSEEATFSNGMAEGLSSLLKACQEKNSECVFTLLHVVAARTHCAFYRPFCFLHHTHSLTPSLKSTRT